jgi:hemolysin activation/secretion protein
MLNTNFDLFYELKQGSVISNTNENFVKYWRVVDGNLEVKTAINKETQDDWHISDLFVFPVNGKFQIEKRFERFDND